MATIITKDQKKIWDSPKLVESSWGKSHQKKLNIKNNPTLKKPNKKRTLVSK